MTRDELRTALVASMLELFELEEADITEESRLYEDLDIDSIDTVDMLLHVKKISGSEIEFEPEQFRDVKTFGDVLDVVSQNV